MRFRFPLFAQILCFLGLHLALLLVLFIILFSSQFGVGWNLLVTSPIGSRVESVAWEIFQQTRSSPTQEWNNILDEFGKFYGVKFYLFDVHCHQLAGEPVELPEAVKLRVTTRRIQLPLPTPGSFRVSRQSPTVLPLPPSMPPEIAPPDMIPPPLAVPLNSTHPLLPPFQFAPIHPHGRFLLHTRAPNRYWIGVRFPLRDRAAGPGTLLAAAPSLWNTRLFLDFSLFMAAVIGILAISLLIWWPFVYQMNRRLAQLTLATEKIAEGKFDTSLKPGIRDEIGRLAEAINTMADRLNVFVTGQKRFLGDIAHELCTPVSRLQLALELLESADGAEREKTFADLREEVEEVSNLINELLAFSKAGLRGTNLQLQPVELRPLLLSVIEKTCPADKIILDAPAGLYVLADRLLLERAVINVLRNGVRYALKDGPLEVQTSKSGEYVYLTFRDHGPGVPPEAIARLGEPFYRPEASRARSSGGVGLGLAIVKSCIEACDGLFSTRNRKPSGLEVELRFKMAEQHALDEYNSTTPEKEP